MRLIGGFSIVLLLLILISCVGFFALNAASSGFTKYREMARDSNLTGLLQADMLMVRMSVKELMLNKLSIIIFSPV